MEETIVLTGELQQCDRAEFLNIVNATELSVSGTISKHTTYLIAGNGAQQGKIDRANQLGIPILSEDEFWELLYSRIP